MMENLWIALLIVGFLLFALSLFMMLRWKVINLIDELSGRKAKRQIKKLREYNSSSGDMTSVSTGELELLMSGGGSLLEETAVVNEQPRSRSLKEMIDDPYGSVGKGASRGNNSVKVSDEGVLSSIQEEIKSKKSIIIVDEQSSL